MKGRGNVPGLPRGWPGPVAFDAVSAVGPISTADAVDDIDDLVTRWLRSTLRGGRAWGGGYYGFSMAHGIQALALNLACVGWLARVHAAGRGLDQVDLEAASEALSRVDRTAGRARWLGSSAERMRLRYFAADDGLRRLVRLSW